MYFIFGGSIGSFLMRLFGSLIVTKLAPGLWQLVMVQWTWMLLECNKKRAREISPKLKVHATESDNPNQSLFSHEARRELTPVRCL